jgi:NADH-quinone oxidoreductase subunit N
MSIVSALATAPVAPAGGGMPVGDVLPELALLGGSVVTLLYALFVPRRRQGGAALLAVVTLALAAALTAGLTSGRGGTRQWLTFSDTYVVDGGAIAAKLIVLAIAALVVALSVEWFRSDPRQGELYALLLLSSLGAILLAGAADLLEVVLGVLLSSATGYVLVAYHRRSRRAAEASVKYYLLGALTSAVLVYGVVLLFGLAGTTTLPGLARGLVGADPVALVAAVGLVVVGLAFKMGAVPAHAWMPDVADGAPLPMAAFVTTVPKVGALVALGRLALVLPATHVGWRPVVALMAAATMTLGNVAALWQDDVRRLLGWSAVSQTGYALMGVVALGRSPLAVPALLYFLAAYALGAVAAFGVVVELRGQADRTAYAGLAATHPWLAAALVVSFLSFVGIPPTAGFAGKLALFGATLDAGYGWLALLAVANSVVSLAYYARVLGPAFFVVRAESPLPVLGRWSTAAVALSAAAVIIVGVGAGPVLGALRTARLLPG